MPDRITAETFSIFIAPDENLSLHRLGTKLHQRKKAMRRRAGDDLEQAIFLELRKRADNIPSDLIEIKVPRGKKPLGIEMRQLIERESLGCSVRFLGGKAR